MWMEQFWRELRCDTSTISSYKVHGGSAICLVLFLLLEDNDLSVKKHVDVIQSVLRVFNKKEQ